MFIPDEIRQIKGVEDFQDVAEISLGDTFAWRDINAWYSPSRRQFFWLSDEGCSCSSIWDDVRTFGDFSFGSRAELESAIRSIYEWEIENGDTPYSEMLSALSKVREFSIPNS